MPCRVGAREGAEEGPIVGANPGDVSAAEMATAAEHLIVFPTIAAPNEFFRFTQASGAPVNGGSTAAIAFDTEVAFTEQATMSNGLVGMADAGSGLSTWSDATASAGAVGTGAFASLVIFEIVNEPGGEEVVVSKRDPTTPFQGLSINCDADGTFDGVFDPGTGTPTEFIDVGDVADMVGVWAFCQTRDASDFEVSFLRKLGGSVQSSSPSDRGGPDFDNANALWSIGRTPGSGSGLVGGRYHSWRLWVGQGITEAEFTTMTNWLV